MRYGGWDSQITPEAAAAGTTAVEEITPTPEYLPAIEITVEYDGE